MTSRFVLVALLLYGCGGSNAKPDPDDPPDTGPPTVIASANALSGLTPLLVGFTCSATGGDAPLEYVWDFGDGTQSPLQNPSHTYTQQGMFTAMCQVTDATGDVSTASVLIAAGGAAHQPHAQIDVLNTMKPGCAVTGQTLVELTAAGSTSPDNETLWYEWVLLSAPVGSTAQLSSSFGAKPVFRPDVDGSYVVRLHVEAPSGLSDNVDVTISSQSASRVVTVSGANQTAAGGGQLTYPLIVGVQTECGLPVSGKTVTFSVPNGTATPASGVSNATGLVTTNVTIGCQLGSGMVTAALSGTPATDTISYSATLGPAYRVVLSKPSNTQVPGPMSIHAEVQDRCNNIVTTDNTTAFTLAITEATADATAQFIAVTTGAAVATTDPRSWIVRAAGGIVNATLGDTAAETITFLMTDSQNTGLLFVGGSGSNFDQTKSNVAVVCNGGIVTVSFPAAPPPLGNGTLTVSGTVDSDTTDEYVSVYGESTSGTLLANMFGVGVVDCGFQSQQASVPQSLLQAFQADGTITLQVRTGTGLDCFCAPDSVSIRLSYPAGTTADFTP